MWMNKIGRDAYYKLKYLDNLRCEQKDEMGMPCRNIIKSTHKRMFIALMWMWKAKGKHS